MSRKKNRRIVIVLQNGARLVLDRKDIAKVILPSVNIVNKYYRLVLDLQKDIEKQIKEKGLI